MKPNHNTHADDVAETFSRSSFTSRFFSANRLFSAICMLLAVAGFFAVTPANAQGIRSQFQKVRVTVPVSSTNITIIGSNPSTNDTVVLVNTVFPDLDFTNRVTNVVFSVSGLPANASAVLVDANGNGLTSTTRSTNLVIQLYTTNITEGIYTFTLNADGLDSNGAPVTNSFPFVIQAAHIWKGAGLGEAGFGVSNNWANATSWQGIAGVPVASSDVVFGDSGAQTNATFNGGVAFTNIGIDADVTIASLRFAQTAFTNLVTTNQTHHSIRIAPGVTLSVTGSNGFSLLRDYIGEFNYYPDNPMSVSFSGTNGTLFVSNAVANFAILVGSQQQPSLSLSNLGTFVTYVSRIGLSDYLLYPNYKALNYGYNGGRDTNTYRGLPQTMWNNVYLARTNFITATYKNPDNYTNENTRAYSLMLQNNDQSGNGSGTSTFFYLGVTNVFKMDSICLIGANSASGNNGAVKFYVPRFSTAIFRGTNGGRMSLFAISDNGGTNEGGGNVKANIDFTGVTNYVDILADRLIVARDRTLNRTNGSFNVTGDLTVGYGNVDVNTMILGCQEHSNKIDSTTLFGNEPYLGYCRGRLTVTNGGVGNGLTGTVKINGTLTLGYTADNNPPGSAQQYNNWGQVTIYSNATVIVSNIVCDGGLNYWDGTFGRQNTITINQGGNLVVSNTVGYPNPGANDFTAADPRGLPLDSLVLTAGRLTLNVDPSKTNIIVRSLSTPGTIPSVIKVAQLTGVSSYPVQIPVISYKGSASPFLTADVSALGGGFFCYVLNNQANKTVDLFITTNSPNNLIWTGGIDNNWDTTTKNWVTAVGGFPTNFNLGDIVTFNDTSSMTNVNIVDSQVPGQTGAGVTISNNLKQYTFSGGTIAGTALVVKQGTNSLEFDAIEQGPISIVAGNVAVNGGSLGTSTLWSNTVLNVVGNINGGLTSTGTVSLISGTLTGPVSIQGGSFVNSGTINTLINNSIAQGVGTTFSNAPTGTINVGAGTASATAWDVPYGSTLVNMGSIFLYQPRITVEGALYGTGKIEDPSGGGYSFQLGNPGNGFVRINGLGVVSPGATLEGSIATMNLNCRFDWESDPQTAPVGFATVRIDVDFSNPLTNDIFNCDRWNNDTGFLLMTNINPGAGVFANGQTFTIMNNARTGYPTNFIDTAGFCPTVIPFIPGPGLVWNTTNFNVYGRLSVTTNTMVWDGVSSANWGTNNPADTSWKTGQPFQNAMGAFFGDNASGSTTVNLITNVSPSGITGQPISNNATIFPGVVVSNAALNYVITGVGKISGPTAIYKTGPGNLSLLTSNDYIGNTILENGTLTVSNFVSASSGYLVSIASLGGLGGGQMKNSLIFEGGKLDYVGKTNCVLNQWTQFEPNGASINVSSASNTLTLAKAPAGPGGLTKTGPGTLVMNSGNAFFFGDVNVNGGTLRLNAANTVGIGTLTLNNGVVLETTNFNLNFTNPVNVAGVGVAFNFLTGSTNIFSGPWIGAGSVTFSNISQFVFNGSLSNFSGSISLGGTSANYLFNNTTNKTPTNGNPCRGSALASFDLGTGANTLSNLNGAGLTYFLGALSGGPNTVLGGRATNSFELPTTSTYNIGANGNSTTFSGKIADGIADAVTVVKTGTGSLLLNGNSTYTGSTTVSNGVLGGTGSIASALSITSAGTLSPGASSVGTFTVSNSVTLNGTTLMELNQASPATNDLLVVTGTLTGGGTLLVTNIGPNIINGSVFKLFSKPVTGFTTTTLPSGGGSYVWNNTLAANGSITLISGGASGVNTNATNIVVNVSGSMLTLSWPIDHIGWRLQAQTNSLSVGLNTNWSPVAGSDTTNSMNFLMNLNNGSVFYRLVYP